VDYTTSAVPVSATAAATGFHTDSSSVDTWPDIVGLLCESPGTRGGESLITNGLRAHRELRLRAPEALAILERDFIRDVVTPGRERTRANLLRNRFPIFAGRGGAPTLRYMRYWVERGQSAAGLPLSHQQTAALDALDEVLQAPENVVQFRLERGDMLFLDNQILAHNRLAYHDAEGHMRRLQRIWISARRPSASLHAEAVPERRTA
ncbi:MAG: TauD/TfdA family dioxygenase, partial [Myxococcota bacterium]|nr:TauD/TfdA family dioxygenase [Myxococcota bacterium]